MNELEAVKSALQECLASVFGLERNGLKCVAAIVRKQNTAAETSQLCFLSRPGGGGGAKVQSGGPLTALVFRRFNHGSESGVFVCQQGSRAVELQDLPGVRTEWKRTERRLASA